MNQKESRNPADIFLDIARRLGIPLDEEQKKRIQEMRDYCDEEVEQSQCEHSWVGGEMENGWVYLRCRKCPAEKRYPAQK